MPTDLLIPAGPLPFYTRGRTLDFTKTYNGSLLSFLATGRDTAGRSALVEFRGQPGHELPPRTHAWEHATYVVLEGELEFHCADQMRVVPAGALAFAPQGAPHAFRIRSPRARVLVAVQAVGEHAVGLDQFWLAASSPATSLTLPPRSPTYTTDDPLYAVRLGATHGLHFLTAAETAVALPHYASPPPTEPDDDDTDLRGNPLGWVMEPLPPAPAPPDHAQRGLTSHETIW
jgi:quercetin dioxygenase-like cupin family protein